MKCENHCPKCNSDDIEWGDHVHGDVIYQKATCNECDCDFKEYYSYTDTEIDTEIDEKRDSKCPLCNNSLSLGVCDRCDC